MIQPLISRLLNSPDPIIRYKTLVFVQGSNPGDPEVVRIQEQIPTSPLVRELLIDRGEDGLIPFHPYTKWQGAHWVLTCLADTCYPPGDMSLLPLRDQVYEWLFSKEHWEEPIRRTGSNLQIRMHASMEANALFSSLRLGLTDERTPILVERLLWAQWKDGGWNCDQHKAAHTSSFFESITPLRALALYTKLTGDPHAAAAVERATEVFLSRQLFRRLKDGQVIRKDFLNLSYPCYWYYDILFGLKVMAEAGFIDDPRCNEALDLLESKQLIEGGWAAETKHYTVFRKPGSFLPRGSRTAWGVTGRSRMNEFITVDAMSVLRQAKRLPNNIS